MNNVTGKIVPDTATGLMFWENTKAEKAEGNIVYTMRIDTPQDGKQWLVSFEVNAMQEKDRAHLEAVAESVKNIYLGVFSKVKADVEAEWTKAGHKKENIELRDVTLELKNGHATYKAQGKSVERIGRLEKLEFNPHLIDDRSELANGKVAIQRIAHLIYNSGGMPAIPVAKPSVPAFVAPVARPRAPATTPVIPVSTPPIPADEPKVPDSLAPADQPKNTGFRTPDPQPVSWTNWFKSFWTTTAPQSDFSASAKAVEPSVAASDKDKRKSTLVISLDELS